MSHPDFESGSAEKDPRHFDVAGGMFSGYVKRRIERDPKFAVVYYEKESKHAERKYGTDAPQALNLRQEYAVALHRSGKSEKAEAGAEMAGVVEKLTAANGSDDPDTLLSRTSQAVYLDTLGRRAESEAAWRGLAEAKGRVLGSDHADTIGARERLAATLYAQRRLQEAAAEYGEAAALRAAAVGADHPDTERARGWQAAIQRELEGPDQAGTV